MTEGARVLLSTDAVGGVWCYSLDLARGLAARGTDLTLAVLGPTPTAPQLDEANAIRGMRTVLTGLPLDWTARTAHEVAAASEQMAKLADETGADLVHLHSPSFACGVRYPAPLVAVAHSCPATWWRAVRTGPPPDDFRWRIDLMRRGLTEADAVIVPSNSFARELDQVYGAGAPRWVVHNGRPRESVPSRQRTRAVLTAGRLWDEGKNVGVLDRAAAILDAPVRAAGPMQGMDGSCVHFANLHMLGSLSQGDLRLELASAGVFASPALYEPFGLGVLEAAHAGLPLVLSDIATFRELWEGACIFVDPHDAGAWAAALGQVLDAPDMAAALGEGARERSTRYPVGAMMQRTVAVHRSVLRQAAPAA
jgi:glycosyltransferase involved in cell wall biosynthesis